MTMVVVVSLLCMVLCASLCAAQVYPTMRQSGNPWFLTDNVQIEVQNDTNVIDTHSINDELYVLTGNTSLRSLSIYQYARTAKTLRRVHLDINEAGFPGFDPYRNNSDVALAIDPTTGDAHVVYTFADKIGIQTYSTVISKFQATDVSLNISSEYIHYLPSSRTGVNPKIVCSLNNGSLLVGLYQHNTDDLTDLHAWYTAQFQGPPFSAPINSYYSTERAYSITISSDVFRVQNATHVFYLRQSQDSLVMENMRKVGNAENNLISRFSVTAQDVSDNSEYYMYQEPVGFSEAWGETRSVVLHHLDANDSFVGKTVLVPYVPSTVPYFYMDLKITAQAVYCIFVSIQPLIFSNLLHLERRYGGREIVLIKINKTDLSYIAHTGVSTIGDDSGFRFYVEEDGSVFILGTTNADMAHPSDTQYLRFTSTTVFVSRFQSLEISSFITPTSLSNASGYRIQENKDFSVVLTQDITRLTADWFFLIVRSSLHRICDTFERSNKRRHTITIQMSQYSEF
ncbi:hypothetical protein BKA69DRAFT_64268 [Paraphysoderma sedebokerense]|nr:hypothetical protein BKA69DRAFT_64268 [Paraphysoderma sedebokerense]